MKSTARGLDRPFLSTDISAFHGGTRGKERREKESERLAFSSRSDGGGDGRDHETSIIPAVNPEDKS